MKKLLNHRDVRPGQTGRHHEDPQVESQESQEAEVDRQDRKEVTGLALFFVAHASPRNRRRMRDKFFLGNEIDLTACSGPVHLGLSC